ATAYARSASLSTINLLGARLLNTREHLAGRWVDVIGNHVSLRRDPFSVDKQFVGFQTVSDVGGVGIHCEASLPVALKRSCGRSPQANGEETDQTDRPTGRLNFLGFTYPIYTNIKTMGSVLAAEPAYVADLLARFRFGKAAVPSCAWAPLTISRPELLRGGS